MRSLRGLERGLGVSPRSQLGRSAGVLPGGYLHETLRPLLLELTSRGMKLRTQSWAGPGAVLSTACVAPSYTPSSRPAPAPSWVLGRGLERKSLTKDSAAFLCSLEMMHAQGLSSFCRRPCQCSVQCHGPFGSRDPSTDAPHAGICRCHLQ